jgi:predicted dehydrogenase
MKAHRRKLAGVSRGPIRYAVVGLGHIAQNAVLPAFRHAENSRVVALISDDPVKREKLGRKYRVANVCRYEDSEACLRSGEVDAVYVSLPNSLHREFAIRAARAGVHVLCEKPLAVTEQDCEEIIRACAENGVKLMTAYRLHFTKANLEAIRVVQSGEIGDARIFNSLFTMQIKEGNIRLQRALGGGTLYDIGIYCINAARYLFRDEPIEVFGFESRNGDKRFREVDEMTSAVMRFPGNRLASFTCSFGAADASRYEVVGTQGVVRLNNAYEYAEKAELEVFKGGNKLRRVFAPRDQFAAELIYFSDCLLHNRVPEPSGIEGLIDVHILRTLYESARAGRAMQLKPLVRQRRPGSRQQIDRPPVRKPALVHAQAPSRQGGWTGKSHAFDNSTQKQLP